MVNSNRVETTPGGSARNDYFYLASEPARATGSMQHAHKPREVTLLAQVVEQVCVALGNCDEATRDTIAVRVIACAARGERDFERLLAFAKTKSPE